MPVVLDYTPEGAIVSGYYFSHIPDGVVEMGTWQPVIVNVIYTRMAPVLPPVAPMGMIIDRGRDWQQDLAQVSGELGIERAAGQQADALQGWGLGRENFNQNNNQNANLHVHHDTEDDINQVVNQTIEENNKHNSGAAGPSLDTGDRSSSPSPTATRSPKRRRIAGGPSFEVTLPIAVDVEETTGVASVANTAIPNKKTAPRAAQIPHVGRVFQHRRALLQRTDKPYICNLCGTGFAHPLDVRSHFAGHPDEPGRGCWAKHGAKAGVAFNGHASCRIVEADLNVARCKEGWVIVDQESWDRVEAAAEAGREFKKTRVAVWSLDADMEKVGEPMKEDSAEGAATTKVTRKQTGKRTKSVTKAAAATEKKEVATGNETASNENNKASKEAKEPPKRKIVRAGDDTETDFSKRKK